MEDIKKQFDIIKAKNPDAIILFRGGDWYVSYYDDAKVVADICAITLTKHKEVPQATFPYTALDTYLPKMIRAGQRIFICDMMETEKKLVKRGITESK